MRTRVLTVNASVMLFKGSTSGRAKVWVWAGFHSGFQSREQLGDREVEGPGKLGSGVDGDRLLTALDGTDVSAVQAAAVGELFLRQSHLGAKPPDQEPKLSSERATFHEPKEKPMPLIALHSKGSTKPNHTASSLLCDHRSAYSWIKRGTFSVRAFTRAGAHTPH